MTSVEASSPNQDRGRARAEPDMRAQVASALADRLDPIASDTAALFGQSATEPLDRDFCRRTGDRLVRLVELAVRNGRLDARERLVADLCRDMRDRSIGADRLFSLAYLSERTALDDLAVDPVLGATGESWPLVAQLVRRASFDLLAACATRLHLEPGRASIVDDATTLYTRPMFDAVLAKEAERASRSGEGFSLILFDVDRLAAINDEHGWGVGDQILARVGVLIRTYFRQQDWVARHADDSVAVLLTRTDPSRASALAEQVRSTVEARLGSTNHRTGSRVLVTVSAAVISVQPDARGTIDVERLMAGAEAAVARAKHLGRNRIERVDRYQPPYSSS